ncbi:MAG TPA: nucleotide-binding domain containing protein, partial [Leifsonia sp.]
VGTPATPEAGRTQYASVLFVHGTPLAESPMRDHPLTPMRDSNLVRLLRPQTPHPVSCVPWATVRHGDQAVRDQLAGAPGHVLVDALDDDDLDVSARSILALAEERPVVAAGAAGLGTALARTARARGTGAGAPAAVPAAAPGRPAPLAVRGRLIVAGSASAATRAQVAAFAGEQHTLDPLALADGREELDRVREALRRRPDHRAPVVVRAQNEPAQVAGAQRILGPERAASLIERALTDLTAFAVHELGYSHVLVAGGETSGAVVAGLGVQRLTVARQAAPGVPWTVGESAGRTVALLLKSGNFGDEDLFRSAWEVAP